MTRQAARPHPESDRHVLCPFCETAYDVRGRSPWCSGCGARATTTDDGVTFDDARKADRQTLAESASADGGRGSGPPPGGRRKPVRLGKKR